MEMLKIAGQTGIPLKQTWAEKTAGRTTVLGKVQGVYTGFCSTLLRDIPFSMFYFPAYAGVRHVMATSLLKPGEEPTFGKFYSFYILIRFYRQKLV